MRTSSAGIILSVVAFIVGLTSSLTLGADYWQGLMAGSLFAIWVCFVSGEEEKVKGGKEEQ